MKNLCAKTSIEVHSKNLMEHLQFFKMNVLMKVSIAYMYVHVQYTTDAPIYEFYYFRADRQFLIKEAFRSI